MIETVGTQEIKIDLRGLTSDEIGQGPRVKGRLVGSELERLDDAGLVQYLGEYGEGYSVMRNGPCYERIDEETGGEWTLALIATDQDPPHDGDTLGIAEAKQRWFRRTRRDVTVLDPYVVTERPDRVSEALATRIDTAVTNAIDHAAATRVYVLVVGGTPAMRMLTERSALRHSKGTVIHLDPDGIDGTTDAGVLELLEADTVQRELLGELRAAIQGARYRSAQGIAERMGRLGLLKGHAQLAAWCEVGARIAEDEHHWTHGKLRARLRKDACDRLRAVEAMGRIGTERRGAGWIGRVLARIGLIARMERDGRHRDALMVWSVASELLPLVWIIARGKPASEREVEKLPQPWTGCEERPRQADPAGRRDIVRAGADAAVCLGLKTRGRSCAECPYRAAESLTLAGRLWTSGGDGGASVLRYPGESRRLPELRNAVAHAGAPGAGSIERATERAAQDLERAGLTVGEERTLAGLLRSVAEGLTASRLPDPFAVIEQEFARLLRS